MSGKKPGVSFIVPVRNGERWLDEVLAAILAEADGRPMEVLVVEDGSTDRSPEILQRYVDGGRVRVLQGERRGAAAAINVGIRHAVHPIVCQVDQDVIVQPGWMARLTDALAEPGVAAVQGYYTTDPDATVWARAMGLDLEHRYSNIAGHYVDHVCTGNSAYRTEALREVGLFDESFGYGYDNDMSYRLADAGHRLAFCRDARSTHRWREGVVGYLRQQYGMGYGRLDLIGKHRRRFRGDDVSRFAMILHAPLMLCAALALACAAALALLGRSWLWPVAGAGGVLLLLAGERLVAGLQAVRRFKSSAGWYFVPAHLLRDLAWVGALLMWGTRRLFGRPMRPTDSM